MRDDTDEGGGETKGEGTPSPHPPLPSAAQPVKTLPRPVYDGDKLALINLIGFRGFGGVDKARDLIARGINLDEQNDSGMTSLMYAVFNNLEIVQELIRADAALNVQDNQGGAALMYAASDKSIEIVQELIRAGAALDVQAKNGATALMCAARNEHPEIVQELIRAGACRTTPTATPPSSLPH